MAMWREANFPVADRKYVASDQRLSSEEEVWPGLECAWPFYTFWLALKF